MQRREFLALGVVAAGLPVVTGGSQDSTTTTTTVELSSAPLDLAIKEIWRLLLENEIDRQCADNAIRLLSQIGDEHWPDAEFYAYPSPELVYERGCVIVGWVKGGREESWTVCHEDYPSEKSVIDVLEKEFGTA